MKGTLKSKNWKRTVSVPSAPHLINARKKPRKTYSAYKVKVRNVLAKKEVVFVLPVLLVSDIRLELSTISFV